MKNGFRNVIGRQERRREWNKRYNMLLSYNVPMQGNDAAAVLVWMHFMKKADFLHRAVMKLRCVIWQSPAAAAPAAAWQGN